MSRHLLSLILAFASCLSITQAQDSKPDVVEKSLAIQKAMRAAEDHLTTNQPAAAVAVLEAQLDNANGNRAFLTLLQRAYVTELKQLETAPSPDTTRITRIRRMLNLLDGPPAVTPGVAPVLPASAPEPVSMTAMMPSLAPAADTAPPIPTPTGNDVLREARNLFKQGQYSGAAAKFSAAVAAQATLSTDEVAAWAYCRVRVAAERVNNPVCDAASAMAAERDVVDALRLAPGNPELQRVGQAVLLIAKQRQTSPNAAAVVTPPATTLPADWEVVESDNFRVRFKGSRKLAEDVSRTAEAKRVDLFERWSGPAGGNWQPKCEIVLHPTTECYGTMTRRPAGETGHATVRLTDRQVSERRIELRADDAGVVSNTLPRELTHVVLADLFPTQPPPKWAEEGMAVLAGSPDEVGRYIRTLARCAQNRELIPLAALLEAKDFPTADRITAFYCQSVSLVEYLVKLRGERQFTIFLRDCSRYGMAAALKQNYSLDGPAALDRGWNQAAFETTRSQVP